MGVGMSAVLVQMRVALDLDAARHDEIAVPHPHHFDAFRTPNRHQSFGLGGPHFCIGAHLARIEIAAMLRAIFTRLPDITPAGPVEWLPSVFISGPRRLPVRFTPGRVG